MAWLSENLPNTLAVNFWCDLESVRMSCMTTIEGKGYLSAHIKKWYLPCTLESKLGYIAPRAISNWGQIAY